MSCTEWNRDVGELLGNLSPAFPQSQHLPPRRQDQVPLAGREGRALGYVGPQGLEVPWGGAGPGPAHKGLRH